MRKTIFVLALLLFPHLIFAIEYRYLQTIGEARSIQTIEMDRDAAGQGYSVSIRDSLSPETLRLALAADLSTLEWIYTYPEGRSGIFTRAGNVIRSKGFMPGMRPVAEDAGDDAPWFAAPGVCLGGFVRGGEPKTAFWTVDPSNGKAYKMTAKRAARETIECDGLAAEAVRIKVSVSGVPAAFFSTDYWCRESDGLLLRFEGTSRGPGSPKSTLELAKEFME